MDNNELLLLVKRLTKLIKEFNSSREITPEEFVDKKYTVKLPDIEQELYNHFLFLMKHKEFLDRMVKNFWKYYNLCLNAEITTVLFYLIIFILNEDNCKEISKMFTRLNFQDSLCLVEYLQIEDNIVTTAQAACKVFGNDYVLENILNPILKHTDLIEQIINYISEDVKANTKIPIKCPTVPIPPKCLTRKTRVLIAPTNSVNKITSFKSTPVTVKKRDETVNNNLGKAHRENREKAEKLLQYARDNAFNCAKVQTRVVEDKVNPPPVIKFVKPPPKKNVAVKSTTTSLMREAALVTKTKESEIQKIEALMQGAFDPAVLENLDDEVRQYNEQHNLQEIERKHLQGLLTYEEAKIAKQNVVQENRLKMEEFKKERERILVEIEVWKEEEQQKIKLLVEKCQKIEKAAREAEEKMILNKKKHAKMIDNETKAILKEAYMKKQRELAEKVKLIQELRALEQVRTLQIKEFDPTECPNFGLLCEMSIAELQERLGLLKMQLQEELEKKKNVILDNKKKQQKMIESLKTFVENNKVIRIKPQKKVSCKLQLTPEIISLRERLENLKHCKKVNEIQAASFMDA